MSETIDPQQILIQALLLHANSLSSYSIPLLTTLINSNQANQTYTYYILRGNCYQSLNNLQEAINDYQEGILLDQQKYDSYLNRGICYFKQGKIDVAKQDLQQALNCVQKQKEVEEYKNDIQERIQLWLNKCEIELENIEYKKIIQQKQEQVIKSSSGKIAYQWYQTDEKVIIQINHQLPDQSQLKTQFNKDSIELSFPLTTNNDYNLQLDLYDQIISEKTEVKCQLKQIDIIMFKKNINFQWKKLEKIIEEEQQQAQSQPKQQQQKIVEQKAPVYPSSSKYYKDWDKLGKEIDKEFATEKTEDPMAGIFGEIYRNADENTKRAMIKSYQTSGGTVLSTNWDEVQNKDYEGKDRPEAPKGQEWQKWEK